MAEQINLITPDQANPGTSNYEVVYLELVLKQYQGFTQPQITIGLLGQNGLTKTHITIGETAKQRIVFLNTANLSIKSLYRRILEILIADGIISGNISGAPD